jgi:hypothetical protein
MIKVNKSAVVAKPITIAVSVNACGVGKTIFLKSPAKV